MVLILIHLLFRSDKMTLEQLRETLFTVPDYVMIDDKSPDYIKMIQHFEKNPTDIEGFIAKWGQTTPRICQMVGLEYDDLASRRQVK